MSLLLDARKKSQQAQAGKGSASGLELSLEPSPDSTAPHQAAPNPGTTDGQARLAGQNLFNAKSGPAARPGFNRNLLIALVGTVILLAAGAGYVWYEISPHKALPPRPVNIASTTQTKPAPVPLPAKSDLVPGIVSAEATPPKPARIRKPRHAAKHLARATPSSDKETGSVHIVRNTEEPIDPLLNNAYLAYRGGKLDQAQQLYLKALSLDSNNTDGLLGMAVIAQRRGEDSVAAHYYAQVLALDPRNAVANAGMSALSDGNDTESRLKMLLNEQQNSSSLHLALGNYYAEHDRWAEAQQSYFNAYKLAPDRAELAFNLAVSLDRIGQNKAAAQYYRRALQLDPDNHAGFDHAKISQRIEQLTH
ncbi:MAG TPA: tetratricopeptide repeat protein [Gallionella sp.]|nr:tetratricopeptide repeat protein [Gallionella sp.]